MSFAVYARLLIPLLFLITAVKCVNFYNPHNLYRLYSGTSASGWARRSSCSAHGGICEPVLSCLLTLGVVSGSCGNSLWSVCCAMPSSSTAVSKYHQNSGYHPPQDRYISREVITSSGEAWSRSSPKSGRSRPVDFGPVVNDPQCGRHFGSTRRVLDGQPAGFGSFPWQALIKIGKGKCGGVLISHRHVVTAGHCVKNKEIRKVLVTLGEYHLKKAEPLPSQTFRVVRAVVHPRFRFSPAADRYDVAVLTLNRRVTYAPHIAPICLPEAGRDPDPGTTAYVAGWGALIPDDVSGPLIQFLVPEIKRPSVLQVVNVPVLENEQCESWHHNQGIMVQQADGRWVLIGLVSAGFSCGKPGQPGIYHRISSTADWITYQAYNNARILH